MGYTSLAFPFVFCVMILSINFLLYFLGFDFMVITIITIYILLRVENYVYFYLDFFYILRTFICLISHFEICLGARKACLFQLQNHQAQGIQLVAT